MNNRKLINIVKGDIQNAINNGDYARNTERNSNIEFDTKNKQILLDGVPYSNPLMVETTYNELKTLRDNSQLVPGSFYRITDYNCTTTQENTKSAGHQFDIVLLAISENKLAEESWAMEHPTDVYDVICTDNIIIKCYYYTYYDEEEKINLVNVDTLLGNSGYPEDYEGIINHETKTITPPVDSATLLNSLSQENLTYNYFQNSNLEAWKVWYCLDNDTARFAWADDSVDEDSPSKIEFSDKGNTSIAQHQASEDIPHGKVAWIIISGADIDTIRYTDSRTPNINDSVYIQNNGWQVIGTVSSYTPDHEGTGPNGRGVIYRLIDEWNNDCPYDFKNIQYQLRLDDNVYIDGSTGEYTWVYTFDALNLDTDKRTDATLIDRTILIDDGYNKISNNFIGASEDYNTVTELPYICFLLSWNSDDTYFGVYGNIFNNSHYCYFSNDLNNVLLIGCYFGTESRLITQSSGFYINNRKVLTEE